MCNSLFIQRDKNRATRIITFDRKRSNFWPYPLKIVKKTIFMIEERKILMFFYMNKQFYKLTVVRKAYFLISNKKVSQC